MLSSQVDIDIWMRNQEPQDLRIHILYSKMNWCTFRKFSQVHVEVVIRKQEPHGRSVPQLRGIMKNLIACVIDDALAVMINAGPHHFVITGLQAQMDRSY